MISSFILFYLSTPSVRFVSLHVPKNSSFSTGTITTYISSSRAFRISPTTKYGGPFLSSVVNKMKRKKHQPKEDDRRHTKTIHGLSVSYWFQCSDHIWMHNDSVWLALPARRPTLWRTDDDYDPPAVVCNICCPYWALTEYPSNHYIFLLVLYEYYSTVQPPTSYFTPRLSSFWRGARRAVG